jgi:hypothetical protein
VVRLVTTIGFFFLAQASADVYGSDREGLQLELTPYVWGAGIDGKVSAKGQTAHFDYSVSDLLSKVDAGFMGLAVASYDRIVVYVDYDYIGLSNDAETNAGAKIKVDIDTTIATYSAGYRFDTFGENTLDVMLGQRTLGLDETLKVPAQKIENDASLSDTIVMLRPSFRFAEHWRFNPTLSYGISGDSDTTYEMSPQIQWDSSKSLAVRFGYRTLFYELGGRDRLDISLQGLFLGVGWVFQTR